MASLKKEKNKKIKTITIDARFKENYYRPADMIVKDSKENMQSRYVFWNYMMNVSMQNTVAQMIKA